MIIKCKLWGRYRQCEILRVYTLKSAKDVYLRVRVLAHERTSGMASDQFDFVAMSLVRKADHSLVWEFVTSKEKG